MNSTLWRCSISYDTLKKKKKIPAFIFTNNMGGSVRATRLDKTKRGQLPWVVAAVSSS